MPSHWESWVEQLVESHAAGRKPERLVKMVNGEVDRTTRHGLGSRKRKSKIWRAYHNMKDRCYNPKIPRFMDYGGRGVHMCNRWLHGEDGMSGIVCFAYDMGQAPSKDHSIDRINVNGHYEPSNCRWATKREQAGNKRNSVMVEWRGKTQCVTRWAEELNVSPRMLRIRIVVLKWPIEKAMTQKNLRKNPRKFSPYHSK